MTEPKIVIDTNIVSYIMRGGPLAVVYSQHLQGKLVSISFITVGELYFGAEKAKWGEKRRNQLETTLRNFVVIPYDHDIARCYGRIVAGRERKGHPISLSDAWIAACAVRHGVTLVTHNAKDFDAIADLHIITEQEEAKS